MQSPQFTSQHVPTSAIPARRGTHVLLWILQGLLAALFAFAGVTKFTMPLAEMVKQSGLPGSLLLFVGAMEILGAVGLIVPAMLRIKPVLTPLAAFGLTIIMVGATVISLRMGPAALFPGIVGLLTLFVAYGRLRLAPISGR